ncbi:hypothetical protein [Luteimonas sp. MC1825]|uniref:hypothetical protein n=1 Tax=Luteimonas sp. MC1825 TaxID=2761107 RepID=UPI00161A949B|nr:hypothetical protein [Luteimonas sp. MC1825]MBB6600294.1 hypothetical protein [Luteimonas sp. MC1825]QOC87974.1 hypothetical protein IDM46_12250 [Luteimonas sp. MC1825]
MKTDINFAAKGGEARETRAEKAIRLLTTQGGSPFNQKLDEFQAFYPAVVTAKHNGMKNKQIIKILSEGGLKLYPALFDKLLAAMTVEESESTCPHCKQAIANPMEEVAHTPAEVGEFPETGPTEAEDD